MWQIAWLLHLYGCCMAVQLPPKKNQDCYSDVINCIERCFIYLKINIFAITLTVFVSLIFSLSLPAHACVCVCVRKSTDRRIVTHCNVLFKMCIQAPVLQLAQITFDSVNIPTYLIGHEDQ
jgi:hypothetical protein